MGYMDKRPSRTQGSCQGEWLGQGWGMPGVGAKAPVYLVLPLPATHTSATLVGGF